ncbi:MAG: hypothetical protein ACOYEV_07130 [Candidatus Nanopelagicales bacterium]
MMFPFRFTSSTAGVLAVGLLAVPAAGTGASQTEASALGVPRPTGLTTLYDLSKNGRIALGVKGGRTVVRDVAHRKTLMRLPTGSRYVYGDLSDTGRYVAFSYTPPGSTSCYLPYVRDRKAKQARLVATDSAGQPLRPGWDAQACAAPEAEVYLLNAVSYSAPALSGNGRYVAFCADVAVRGRIDLHVKDLKSGDLRTWPGVCRVFWGEDRTLPVAPQISEDGSVILLPGNYWKGEAAYQWMPASVVSDGALISDVAGGKPRLTADGSAVYYVSPLSYVSPDGVTEATGTAPARYDVQTGTTSALAPGDPGSAPMSRRGRHVVVAGGSATAPTLGVLDRTTAALTDLAPAFGTAGLGVPYEATISGDSKVVFGKTAGVWLALKWM